VRQLQKVILVFEDKEKEVELENLRTAFKYPGFVKAGSIAYPCHRIKEIRLLEDNQQHAYPDPNDDPTPGAHRGST